MAHPQVETRSPLHLLNSLPKEHEKAIKQAFYNTAANIFVLFACAATVAVYFILEAFLKPLLWAVLCGAFLSPFKTSLTGWLRSWLNGLKNSGTPLVLGVVITPIKCVDEGIECVGNFLYQKIKLLLAAAVLVPGLYVLWHFGPIKGILQFIIGLFSFTYDLLGYFSSFWIWSLFIAYLAALVFYWSDESRTFLRRLSIPVWLLVILHVSSSAGILRVPLLIIMGVMIVVGFVEERKEMARVQEEGADTGRKSMFESALTLLMGESPTAESADPDSQSESVKSAEDKADVETISKASSEDRPEVTKPQTLNVENVSLRHPTRTPVELPKKARSLSDQCFIALLWALMLTRIWLHIWLVAALLPLPLGIWLLKKLSVKLSSPGGYMGDKVKVVRRAVGTWIKERRDVIMPNWLRGVLRLVMKADKRVISILESSLDSATSVLFILLLIIGSMLGSVIFAVQVQQESMYLVKTTSNLLNNTLHPEMANWLPNNEDLQQAMDSMVGNAYLYGRNYIASKVRDMVNGPSNNNTQIETQVLDMWDRLYDSWLARNATSTSLTQTGGGYTMPLDITNLTSIWDLVSEGSGFNFSGIIAFVKENIGTFLSVLESVWLVLKGNMNLVLSVLTSTLSIVFGGGTALLNFLLSSVIFLTTLFYLLASSRDQYKPIEWFSAMSPTVGSGANTFGQAVQDAVGGVFTASLKMAVFYGLYTWLTHTLFGVNIVFIPSALAAVFGAIPFVGTYLAAIPAVLELWLVQDQFILAVLLMVCHLLPASVVDTAIYSEIKGGHPYVTGLAIAGGMYWLGLEGAIFGPIILCCLIVLANVYSSMIKPDTPAFIR